MSSKSNASRLETASGFLPPLPSTLEARAAKRAVGCLHGLVLATAFARSRGATFEDLAGFGLGGFHDGGYHEAWIEVNGAGNVEAFVKDFVSGREMIYDTCKIVERADAIEIHTDLWFYDETPEFFFYYDTTPEEFSRYVVVLGERNARMLGIDLVLEHKAGREKAVVRRSADG